jgi:hypothetical protein
MKGTMAQYQKVKAEVLDVGGIKLRQQIDIGNDDEILIRTLQVFESDHIRTPEGIQIEMTVSDRKQDSSRTLTGSIYLDLATARMLADNLDALIVAAEDRNRNQV